MTSGRRPTIPPRGRVTLQQAAKLSKLSYAEVHRRVSTGMAPGEQDPAGVWTMAAADAKRLRRRQKSDDPRKAVMVRVPLAEYRAWERGAGRVPVSAWLRKLANAAAGYEADE